MKSRAVPWASGLLQKCSGTIWPLLTSGRALYEKKINAKQLFISTAVYVKLKTDAFSLSFHGDRSL